MQVRWLRRALRDLDNIGDFIAEDSPVAAIQVVGEIVRRAGLLADQPALGRPGRVPGTRELVISGLPFIVPYRVRHDAVELLSVMHTSRAWPRAFRASESQARYGTSTTATTRAAKTKKSKTARKTASALRPRP